MGSGNLIRGFGWVMLGFNLGAGIGGIVAGHYGSIVNMAWVPILYVMIKINKDAHKRYEETKK